MPVFLGAVGRMDDFHETHSGGCLCGAVRYKIRGPLRDVIFCHCTMCQKGLGNLFGTFVSFKTEYFRYLTNEPNWYVRSDRIKRGFCEICGSPIAYQKPDTDRLAIWIGTLDDPAAYEPQIHVHIDTKISWVDIHPNLPTNEGCS